jgi:hypothetical protein
MAGIHILGVNIPLNYNDGELKDCSICAVNSADGHSYNPRTPQKQFMEAIELMGFVITLIIGSDFRRKNCWRALLGIKALRRIIPNSGTRKKTTVVILLLPLGRRARKKAAGSVRSGAQGYSDCNVSIQFRRLLAKLSLQTPVNSGVQFGPFGRQSWQNEN